MAGAELQTCILKVYYIKNPDCECQGCTTKIKKILSRVDGMKYSVDVDISKRKVTVTGKFIEPDILIQKLTKSGKYKAELWPQPAPPPPTKKSVEEGGSAKINHIPSTATATTYPNIPNNTSTPLCNTVPPHHPTAYPNIPSNTSTPPCYTVPPHQPTAYTNYIPNNTSTPPCYTVPPHQPTAYPNMPNYTSTPPCYTVPPQQPTAYPNIPYNTSTPPCNTVPPQQPLNHHQMDTMHRQPSDNYGYFSDENPNACFIM